MLTLREAAELLRVGRKVLYERIAEARRGAENPIPVGRVGKKYVFDREELLAWMRREAIGPQPVPRRRARTIEF